MHSGGLHSGGLACSARLGQLATYAHAHLALMQRKGRHGGRVAAGSGVAEMAQTAERILCKQSRQAGSGYMVSCVRMRDSVRGISERSGGAAGSMGTMQRAASGQ